MKNLLAALFLLILTGNSFAEYTWNGSYWTDGTNLYTRSTESYLVWTGCCYQTQSRYVYTRYNAPAAATYDDSDVIIAKAIAARDGIKNEIVKRTLLHQQFLEKINKAGLDQGLGYNAGPFTNNNLLLGNYGVTGSSVWGYNQSAQVVNPFSVDLNQAILQYAQLAQGSNDSNLNIHNGFKDTVNLAIGKSADISGIAARSNAIIQFARTLDGPPGQSTFKITPATNGAVAPASELNTRWNQSATSCVQCHYGDKGEKKAGGFSVADFPGMSTTDQAKVIKRLELPLSDPNHMPKGKQLTLEEYRAWVEVASQPATKPEVMPAKKE